jgi:DNA-binding CsgD family transcriptional regulator/lipopolysaccharide biosynthesis regulator YciM
MQELKSEPKLLHPVEIYSRYLETINGVSLTIREVDILSCLVNGRNTKGIANFLSISPKTVASHIYNASNKFGYDTDGMMAFLAKSEQILPLQEYYRALHTNVFFQESLKEIKKLLTNSNDLLEFRLIYWENKPPFLESIRNDLTVAGFAVSFEGRKEAQSFDHLIQEFYHDMVQIYFVPDAFIKQLESQPIHGKANEACTRKIFFFPMHDNIPILPDTFSQFTSINPLEWPSYYSSVFALLKNFLPKDVDITPIIQQFEEKSSPSTSPLHPLPGPKNPIENAKAKEAGQNITQTHRSKMPKKVIYALSTLLPALALVIFWALNRDHLPKIIEKNGVNSFQADLEIPSENILLDRPQLITMIEERFQNQAEGIKTVALVGMGGAGKTTLARQYARLQNSSVVWEISAESKSTLFNSLLALSFALCKTAKEKQSLMDVTKIHDFTEKVDEFVQLLKRQLKGSPNWLLIYDNVGNMRDVQQYFPTDVNGWGTGKIIITTQDNHIQNNGYVKDIVWVGELSDEEKFSLFTRIMNKGDKRSFDSQQAPSIKEFLEKLPSFPLDISTAAYYMKATDTTLEQYLDYLANYDENFSEIQKSICSESTGCQKTRYQIITLTLDKLVAADKNFGDLLLMISFLDSKNIPRFLLDRYKGKLTVDRFVYTLKKYSLIDTYNLMDVPVGQSFLVHQSIQEVARRYLLKKLEMTKDQGSLAIMANILENCAADSINKEDYLNALLLLNHIKAFLNHNSLFNDKIKQSLSCQLGGLYLYLGHYTRAEEVLEKNRDSLNQGSEKNYLQITKNLIYLGNTYRHLKKFGKSRDSLEESLYISKKHLLNNHEIIAQASIYLGSIYRTLKNYEKAKYHLQEGISLYNKHLPENHSGIARATLYLGSVYQGLAYFDQAESSFKQALTIYESKLPQNYAGIGWVLTYLGSLYRDRGNPEKAIDVLKQSLTMYQKCLPENHTRISWVYEKLGLAYKDMGNYTKSKECFQIALSNYTSKYIANSIKAERMKQNIEEIIKLETFKQHNG